MSEEEKVYLDEDGLERVLTKINADLEEVHRWVHYTISASGWNGTEYSFENDYPTESYDICDIIPYNDDTEDQKQAWSMALCAGRYATNHIIATGVIPTIDIPVAMEIRRKG